MSKIKFIPSDVIYVEYGHDLEFRHRVESKRDEIEKYCQAKDLRFVFLPEVLRYIIPDASDDNLRFLFNELIVETQIDISSSGFLFVNPDGELRFENKDFFDIQGLQNIIFRTELSLVKEDSFDNKSASFCEKQRFVENKSDKLPAGRLDSVSFRFKKSSFCAEGEDFSVLAKEEDWFAEPCDLFVSEERDSEVSVLTEQLRKTTERLQKLGVDYLKILEIIKGKPKLSRLVITEYGKIILPDYGEMEIHMKPMTKALYLLYLKYENGIVFKDLPDYRDELMSIYRKVSNISDCDLQVRAIEAVTDPMRNTINVNCSYIRDAFESRFNVELADYYVVTGKRGELKRIKIDRSLVDCRLKW